MSLNPCQCKYDYIIAKYFLTKYLFTLIVNLDVSAADAEELGLHVSRVRVPKGEPLDEVGADRGGVLVEQSAVLRAGANHGHVLPRH